VKSRSAEGREESYCWNEECSLHLTKEANTEHHGLVIWPAKLQVVMLHVRT